MNISIIILNYNNKGLTLNCIQSIKEADFGNLSYEIIVVDNDSDDNIGQILSWQYPEIIFIQNTDNAGMGVGNNVGLRRARGQYLVVMNPDTLAFKNTFSALHDFMEKNPTVGLVGPKQFNPDRTVQDSCYRWHRLLTPLYRRTFLGRRKFSKQELDRFLMKDFDKEKPREVDWLLGSCFFIRAKALHDIGLFDERFFLYFEDTDLCRRFWQKKWRIMYYPLATIIHNHGRESARRAWYAVFLNPAGRHHLQSWWRYLLKWGLKLPESH